MTRVKHTLRARGRALALTVVLAASTAGCSVFSPFQTAETKPIADGVPVTGLPDVRLDNVALVSGEDGGDAVITGIVENTGSDPVKISLSAGGSSASTTVEPSQVVLLDDEDLTLSGLEDGAGSMADIEVSTGSESIPTQVPVVAPTGYYEPYAPEGWTPEPTPSETEHEESEEH